MFPDMHCHYMSLCAEDYESGAAMNFFSQMHEQCILQLILSHYSIYKMSTSIVTQIQKQRQGSSS